MTWCTYYKYNTLALNVPAFGSGVLKTTLAFISGPLFLALYEKKIWERTVAESNESAIKCRVRHATLSVTVDEQAFYITHGFFN